jgi:radical SAM protein with 4Fe4S-binding SPASM domain
MISLSRLYCGFAGAGDALRYGRAPAGATDHRPVVVWNCTRRCNLACVHCYAASGASAGADELTTAQAKALIEDLAAWGAPALLLSGGEPLLREDLPDLIACARRAGLRTVLSTNGTLITRDVAARLADGGVAYVGVSLDAATPEANDRFRGRVGAFEQALAGIRHTRRASLRVGLRMTLHADNAGHIPGIFDLIEQEDIQRVCFYHLVPAGRGRNLCGVLLPPDGTRRAVDAILDRTRRMYQAGRKVEVLTVDNHADGPYLYLRLRREDPARAEAVYELLRAGGGNGSGWTIGCIGWDGSIHPDQFWRTQILGNVRERPFSEIWSRPPEGSLLARLRDRHRYLQGRCLRCRFLDVCNGNLRARSEEAGNGLWGDDPACYLTDEEIA